jgi:hypothetical protein
MVVISGSSGSALNDLKELLQVLSDPSQARKAIDEAKVLCDEMNKSKEEALALQESAKAILAEANLVQANTQVEAQKLAEIQAKLSAKANDMAAQESEIREAFKRIEMQKEVHANIVSEFEEKTKTVLAQIQKEQASVEARAAEVALQEQAQVEWKAKLKALGVSL